MQLYCVKDYTNTFISLSSHISQVDIKYFYFDMIVPAMMVDHVVTHASLFLTAIQAGDSAMAESLPLVPGYHHTTPQRCLEMEKTCLRDFFFFEMKVE